MQIKGYALEQDRYENLTVHVDIDGAAFAVFKPNIYSPAAVLAYPSLDSSNASFNGSYAATGLSAGTHTVLITALSTDGESTSKSIQIIKQSSGCNDPIVDAAPLGIPINVDLVGDTNVTLRPVIVSAKLTIKKFLKLKVKNAKDDGVSCTLTLYSGKKAKKILKLIVQVIPTKTPYKIKKKLAKYKKVKFVRVEKDCGAGVVTSSSKPVNVKS